MATTTPSPPPAAGAVGALGPAEPAPLDAEAKAARNGGLLLLALVAACAYAMFAHGAVDLPAETRLQLALVVVSLMAAVAWLTAGTLGLNASPATWWGVGLLAGFAVWCGVTLLWSVAPDRTWLATNRAAEYVLVLVLGIAVGSAAARAIERTAVWFLAVLVAVALYAIGGKVLPGVNLPPFFDFNQTAATARLRAPLEYWNALALVCVFGIPIALRLAIDATRRDRDRLAALGAAFLLVIVLGLTYSRGGFLALATALVVMTALGGARLRGIAGSALLALAALAPLAVAFTRDGLTENGAPLDQRIDDGLILLVVLVASAVLLIAAGWALLRIEPQVRWTPARSRLAWRGLAATALLGLVIAAGVLGASDRGLRGSIDHAIDSFTDTKRQDRVYDPVRLVSTNSGNRWVWWKEAAGAFSDKPAGGYGAGSFPIVHKRYRTEPVPVAQPHNVPLQFLAETGFLGAVLALGAIGFLLAAALARLRSMGEGREREIGVALLAGACAWVVHGLFDWDWDIPGVTIPALMFLGVLCGRPGGAPAGRRRMTQFGEPDPESSTGRHVALAGIALLLCAFLVSALLPAWSQSRTEAAQTSLAAEPTPAQLEGAEAKAEVAARLDPLAVEPLFVASAIAQGRGQVLEARRHLLRAADRQPDNPDVWFRLTGIALALNDSRGFQLAATKMLTLDPANGTARALASRAVGFLTPPERSATATGTPLPAVQAP